MLDSHFGFGDAGAEGRDVLHIGAAFDGVALGREVVEEMDQHSLLRAGQHWRAPLLLAVVREDDMDDALHLVLRHRAAFKFALQGHGGDVDVAQQDIFGLRLALAAVGLHLAIVVEKDGQHAVVDTDGVRHTGRDAFEHMQHLVDVVEQPTAESVVDAAGGRILRIGLIELVGGIGDDFAVGRIGAHRKQVGNGGIPRAALNRARQKGIERMRGVGHRAGQHIAALGRPLAVIVLHCDEADQLADSGCIVGGHIPNGEAELFFLVLDFKIAIGRTQTRGAIGAADNDVFCHIKIALLC